MKLLTACLLGVFLLVPVLANQDKFEKKGDKERVYNVSFDTLWSASIKAAAEENAIEYSNEKEGIITYSTGQSKASWGFKISVSLSKVDDNKTRIKLVTKKSGFQLVRWGAEGRRVKEFFEALDKQIRLRLNDPILPGVQEAARYPSLPIPSLLARLAFPTPETLQ